MDFNVLYITCIVTSGRKTARQKLSIFLGVGVEGGGSFLPVPRKISSFIISDFDSQFYAVNGLVQANTPLFFPPLFHLWSFTEERGGEREGE